jgi:hypothetical protein
MRHSFNVASAMPNILAASAVVSWDIVVYASCKICKAHAESAGLPLLCGDTTVVPLREIGVGRTRSFSSEAILEMAIG